MGTSGAYSGAGGKAGKDVKSGLDSWLDSLPTGGGNDPPSPSPDKDTGSPNQAATILPPKLISGLFGLLRPAGGSGEGGGGSGGASHLGSSGARGGGGSVGTGAGRSTRRLSAAGGRAAAGAIAYLAGDRATLQRLGVDYDSLRAVRDPLELTTQIVRAVCGHRANGTLEEAEERYVAASVAEWVLGQGSDGTPPDLDDIARYAIATIIVEVFSSELAAALNDRPQELVSVAESELKDAASVLANQATLTITGPTETELTTAIENGIETLRTIYGGKR